ncbi:MAG TPA: GNAT family N-acetyltransferase [Syntrophomonadaceae bacterium]|nr:GNAT family N-acetyltransferase [Syntrophomonadaceae bacterium]
MPIEDYKIERAQAEDAVAMLKLWQGIPGLGLGQGDDEEALRIFIKRNPSTCLVIRDKGSLIGTVLAGFDGRRGYIYHLAVHQDYQGRGYGKALLNRAMKELQALGAMKIHLFVLRDNPAAAAFYRQQGWQTRHDIQVFSWDAGR